MRLDGYSRRQLEERATEFYLRLQHTNPFPAIAKGVVPNVADPAYNTYISCLPQHIRAAALTLMADERYIDILDTNTVASLVVESPHPEHPEKLVKVPVEFHFSTRRPSATHWGRKAELDPEHPMRREIIQWMYKAREINKDYQRCRNFLITIIHEANTVGQLRSMFPEYIHLLPAHQQEHISKMQKRSRLPKSINLEYLEKHRRFVAEKTALCLLLPEGGEKIWLG